MHKFQENIFQSSRNVRYTPFAWPEQLLMTSPKGINYDAWQATLPPKMHVEFLLILFKKFNQFNLLKHMSIFLFVQLNAFSQIKSKITFLIFIKNDVFLHSKLWIDRHLKTHSHAYWAECAINGQSGSVFYSWETCVHACIDYVLIHSRITIDIQVLFCGLQCRKFTRTHPFMFRNLVPHLYVCPSSCWKYFLYRNIRSVTRNEIGGECLVVK